MVENSANSAEPGGDRVSESLKAAFDKKDYYEAHQIYKSLNFRLLRQKKFQQLSDVLYDGAVKFFQLGLDQSGIDLARMFGDLLDKGDLPVTADLIGKIANIYRVIPSKPENERPCFLNLTITWSKKRNPETKTGHAALHSSIAEILIQEEKYDGAAYHYLRALDPVGCLRAIQLVSDTQEPSTGDEKMEVDSETSADSGTSDQRLLGLAVLDFLALERLDLAKKLFVDYVASHKDPEVRSKCYNFKILALMSALLSLCAKGESATGEEYSPIQTTVCEIYTGNPRVEKLMTRIGQIYCNVKQASASPWSGLLSGMFAKEGAARQSEAATGSDVKKEKVNLHSDFDFD